MEGIANLPTYFAGLLPEGVMFTAVRKLIGSAADDLFAILAATGADAIGDIEVRVPGESERKPSLTLGEATSVIRSLLKSSKSISEDYLSAIPGVQPKLSLGQLVRASRNRTYIAKFPPADLPNLIENEFACMRLAKRCRLNVAEVQIRSEALVVTRFDRLFDEQEQRLLKVHVEDMCQAMDLYPNSKYSLEYKDLLQAMLVLQLSKASLLEALRFYAFSYMIGNGDLHAKNVSLVFDQADRAWHLSPAYDLLSTLPYEGVIAGADRMALALADESYGRFTVGEFVEAGAEVGLPEDAVMKMVSATASLILRHTSMLPFAPETIAIIEGRAASLGGSR